MTKQIQLERLMSEYMELKDQEVLIKSEIDSIKERIQQFDDCSIEFETGVVKLVTKINYKHTQAVANLEKQVRELKAYEKKAGIADRELGDKYLVYTKNKD